MGRWGLTLTPEDTPVTPSNSSLKPQESIHQPQHCLQTMPCSHARKRALQIIPAAVDEL